MIPLRKSVKMMNYSTWLQMSFLPDNTSDIYTANCRVLENMNWHICGYSHALIGYFAELTR